MKYIYICYPLMNIKYSSHMKKLGFIFLLYIASMPELAAWSRLGHEVAVAVAQRHLTEKAKANIARYIDYDLKEDAVWMDDHRRDEHIAFTHHWHTLCIDKNLKYDPNMHRSKLANGDAIRAFRICEGTLRDRRYEHMTDSAVVMALRILIHCVPDMHCPTHTQFEGKKDGKNYEINGVMIKSFHSVYDKMPSFIWGEKPADEIAALIDDASKKERKKIVSGDVYQWAEDIARKNIEIYTWNPAGVEQLNPDTVELSTELVNRQMRDAGYRLAYLLNLYFGK